MRPDVREQLLGAGEAFSAIRSVSGDPAADVGEMRGRRQRRQLGVGVRRSRRAVAQVRGGLRRDVVALGAAGGAGDGRLRGAAQQVGAQGAAGAVRIPAHRHQVRGALHPGVVQVRAEAARLQRVVLRHQTPRHQVHAQGDPGRRVSSEERGGGRDDARLERPQR